VKSRFHRGRQASGSEPIVMINVSWTGICCWWCWC